MAARCVNGHDTPRGRECMYCGGPLEAPAPPPPMAPAYAYAPALRRREPEGFSALGVVSLLLALFFPLGSIPAIVTGSIALSRIRVRHQGGRGVALAGVILGWIGVGLAVLAALIVFATGGIVDKDDPDGGGSGRSATSCQTEARTVKTAVEAYYAMNGQYPASTRALVDANMLREVPDAYELVPAEGQGVKLVVVRGGGCD